MHQVGH